jgi:hypothetical protein
MDSSTEPVNKKESSGKRAMRERTKSAAFDPRAIWCAALGGASQELWGDIVRSEAGQLQFQDDRLFNNVWKRIEGKPARVFVSTFRCYEFVTDPARQPGFDEARRLHDEEMKAARTDSAQLFCRTFRRKVMDSSTRGLRELRTGLSSRLCSIASWMEAQHGFGMWLGFRHYRVGWQSDPDTRGRAVHAWILANALRFLHVYEFSGGYTVTGVRLWEGLGVGTNYEGVPWNQRQWANILRQAARLAEKRQANCTPLENWAWWCYPVFSRYRWSTREVQEAASFRGFRDDASWKVIEKDEADFRRYWRTRGLRFAGTKSKRKNPPLAEFTRQMKPPSSLDPEVRCPVSWVRT